MHFQCLKAQVSEIVVLELHFDVRRKPKRVYKVSTVAMELERRLSFVI
jgi:hypothetical protein